jgi:hypothetical protein
MPNNPEKNIYRQDGELPKLGLHEIDEHLARQGKSVEDLSDPLFRLFVLRTTIGQYRLAADLNREKHGDGVEYNDLRHSQVLTAWIHESRRVLPRERLTIQDDDPFCQRVLSLAEKGEVIAAFDEITLLNQDMPDWVHPDTKFDIMERLRFGVRGSMLEEIILRQMLDETVPGGSGECDNPERLRRYLVLAGSDPTIGGAVDDFFQAISRPDVEGVSRDFFDSSIVDTDSICQLTADRAYRDVAERMLELPCVTFDQEVLLLGAFQ